MQFKRWMLIGLAAGFAATTVVIVQAQQARSAPDNTRASGIALDPDDIGGVVRSAKGPEAGVWVIA
jgi:hypothetical protein